MLTGPDICYAEEFFYQISGNTFALDQLKNANQAWP